MKISIVGAGNMGASAAFYLAEKNVGHIVLVDKVEGRARGKALDLMQAAPIRNYDTRVAGTEDIADIAGSRIVVVTAGTPRTEGMERVDLLSKNKGAVAEIAQAIRSHAPEAMVIVVTEPADIFTHYLVKNFGFDERRVIGVTSILDETRFRYYVSKELGISPTDVCGMGIGPRSAGVVFMAEYSRIAGIPIRFFLTDEEIRNTVVRARAAGSEIVKFLRTGSSFYSPGATIAELVESVLHDAKSIKLVTTMVRGKYGVDDGLCFGVPAKLGRDGVEEIYELRMTEVERASLGEAITLYRDYLKKLEA